MNVQILYCSPLTQNIPPAIFFHSLTVFTWTKTQQQASWDFGKGCGERLSQAFVFCSNNKGLLHRAGLGLTS